MIGVSRPLFGPEVEESVLRVLRSGHIVQGPMVERLEALSARMAGCAYAVAMVNGTAALEAALEVLGIGPGDEVITSPLTFCATANAVLRTGATVRFADIASDYTLDPDAAAGAVTSRTAAILPVHLYGLMADMPALSDLAHRHGLAVVEDAAQSHGASLAGRPAGSFGLGSFSFYATKNVAAGEGGVVTTDDPRLARQLRLLRNQGMEGRYDYETVGHNLRMTDVQAAIAVPQMEMLERTNGRRAGNAARLTRLLAVDPSLVSPPVPPGQVHVWHQYTVLLPPGTDRDAVVRRMRRAGVEPGVYYPRPLVDYDLYRNHPRVIGHRRELPVAADVAGRCLSLPVHQNLTVADLEKVAEAALTALAADRKSAVP